MTSATERLRALLDERGVEWTDKAEEAGLTLAGFADTRWNANGVRWLYVESNGTATLASSRPAKIRGCTPEQAIAATLGSEPSQTVYIVESYDSLTEGGYVEPICYRTKQAAIRCAESLTYDGCDGVRYWARWRELKVVDDDRDR